MNNNNINGNHYDAVIIGAGMSGLAVAIRLAMFDQKVLVLERHEAPGGLNSFYTLRGRKYDVGLHAMTNYVPKGTKGTPLGKLLRQLRIPRDDFALCPQIQSRIAFTDANLSFTNDFAHLRSEIERVFPSQTIGLEKLLKTISEREDTALKGGYKSTRKILKDYFTEPLLIEMLLCPLMFYGSATEKDIDFDQFSILFKSIFLEGFARPFTGVRKIIRVLTQKLKSVGGERKMRLGVKRIKVNNREVSEIELDNGDCITGKKIFSTIGRVETENLCDDFENKSIPQDSEKVLSFVESITLTRNQPRDYHIGDTIVFFNEGKDFDYTVPKDEVDLRSGVICMPNNYQYPDQQELPEGIIRVTVLANYHKWKLLSPSNYKDRKNYWYHEMQEQAKQFLGSSAHFPSSDQVIDTDLFTPLTVERFTGHLKGAIYGSPKKNKDGRSHLKNLFICGTDQGFLGITGALLSGISIANACGLR